VTWLQRHGPATSADLAAEFGEDRGATSYHLRQLARFGFIEEDTDRSSGRRKYWRAIPQDVRLPRRPTEPEVAVAAEELAEFGEEYVAFLKRWYREPGQAPPGSRHISVVFHAFPTPDSGDAS
jgi:DNA-binding MarR family transcriptional regulator